jgi:uncharacterized membrane protein
VITGLTTAVSLVLIVGSLFLLLGLAGAGEALLVTLAVLAVCAVPLTVSVLAILWSAKLYGKNKAATPPPPPSYYQPPPYNPGHPPQPPPPQAPG